MRSAYKMRFTQNHICRFALCTQATAQVHVCDPEMPAHFSGCNGLLGPIASQVPRQTLAKLILKGWFWQGRQHVQACGWGLQLGPPADAGR
mmetsp:Transcript_27868/g.39120  ORF Transcript_27868/g.39120 Transcript_27868/m.39120 type:complete len:91 (-) Transcript_27868:1114-1386(-)